MEGALPISLSLVLPLTLILLGLISVEAQSPIQGKIIAHDAGHGGTDFGATNGNVYEKDVNLAVIYALKEKLEGPNIGAKVVLTRVCDETITSRKERVDWAVEQCKKIAGRKCDALVSVHHNGSTDPEHDGTMVIYNENQDRPLAIALHDALINAFHLPDEGYWLWPDCLQSFSFRFDRGLLHYK